MTQTAKSQAIILDNTRSCDNKNRVVVFTEKYGKLVSSVAGYGKPVNHWGGAFEGGNILELSFLKRGDFYTITGWEIIYSLQDKSVMDFAARELILGATNELLPLNDPEPVLFRWLVWCLAPYGERKLYAYLARLIYHGGFLDFSDKMIVRVLEKNFEEYLEKNAPGELAELLRREVDVIQNFTGYPLTSYDFFKKTVGEKR
ncbi:recombination protein O N-terminal domain-containing protein [bacterium]|nr:recombination protein O N-terminal domain-containing protein [bacterium]